MSKQVKHVSEISHAELNKIRSLVDQYYKADSGGLQARAKHTIATAVINLFTVNLDSK